MFMSAIPSADVSFAVTLYHDVEQDFDSDADPEECRRVVREFLKLESKYGVSVTYNVVGRIFEEQPDLVEWIVAGGHEVAFHSYEHQPDWQPKYYIPNVESCRRASKAPLGYSSPRSEWDEATLKSLWGNRFVWNAEYDESSGPYLIHKGLVRLPIATDDWFVHTGEQTIDEWVRLFRDLTRSRRYFGFGSHDSFTSFAVDERLKAWENVLRTVRDSGILALTFLEAADLFRRTELSRYYTTEAKEWNRATRKLYRTKRFIELLLHEANKLRKPVVADLGSGGGVLSYPLRGISDEIFCVDNSPGMLAEVNPSLKPVLGEATDSGLPDDSIDLIICARVVEYLSRPDALAEEMVRIGKMGATFFVTFPAAEVGKPGGESILHQIRRYFTKDGGESIPDRIRRYFTKDEVLEWARQIGPCRVVGVQYIAKEPGSEEETERYREMENNPPPGKKPSNWVCVGAVKKPERTFS